jgi:uncharacterized protein Yka (UPF0111/DUF47 family)
VYLRPRPVTATPVGATSKLSRIVTFGPQRSLRGPYHPDSPLTTKQSGLTALFGPSNNDRFAALLRQLSETVVQCSVHFIETQGRDLNGILDFEHKADAFVDEIHELLDNSFIMRFDIPDSMKLTDDLDNVIDGMRKVAIHLDVYKLHLGELRPEALELMKIGDRMASQLHALVIMLGEPRLKVTRVRVIARSVDEAEAEADRLVSKVERHLVEEYSQPGANAIGFIAWHQLFHLLEEMTDDANHVARHILSLARKEA